MPKISQQRAFDLRKLDMGDVQAIVEEIPGELTRHEKASHYKQLINYLNGYDVPDPYAGVFERAINQWYERRKQ